MLFGAKKPELASFLGVNSSKLEFFFSGEPNNRLGVDVGTGLTKKKFNIDVCDEDLIKRQKRCSINMND